MTHLDRHIPSAHEGPLEPNYFCRAWNPRRTKYCKARAGTWTSHPGSGRCRIHDGGGDTKLIHGRGRRHPAPPVVPFASLLLQRVHAVGTLPGAEVATLVEAMAAAVIAAAKPRSAVGAISDAWDRIELGGERS